MEKYHQMLKRMELTEELKMVRQCMVEELLSSEIQVERT